MDEILQNDPAFCGRLMDAIRKGVSVTWQRFARLTGTNEPAVRKHWAAGELPAAPPDSIPMREGIVALISAGGYRKSGVIPQFLRDADALARDLLGLPARDDSTSPDGEKTAALYEKSPGKAHEQILKYMDGLGQSEGWLVVADPDVTKPWEGKISTTDMSFGGKTVHLVRC